MIDSLYIRNCKIVEISPFTTITFLQVVEGYGLPITSWFRFVCVSPNNIQDHLWILLNKKPPATGQSKNPPVTGQSNHENRSPVLLTQNESLRYMICGFNALYCNVFKRGKNGDVY